jgi:hypothetical protein
MGQEDHEEAYKTQTVKIGEITSVFHRPKVMLEGKQFYTIKNSFLRFESIDNRRIIRILDHHFMKQIFLYFSLLFCLLCELSHAQVRKYSNEFLAIGVGARSLGMSNASVANVNDVTSGYWNPAGLLLQKSNLQIGLMHANYFANLAKYDFGGVSKRIDSSSAMGFTLIRFGVDDIPNTTQLIDAQGNVDYNRITTFSAADYAFIFSYARKLKIPNLRLGANAKVIRRIVGDFAGAWGFGLDAGAQYDYKNFVFGVMIRDVTSTFNAWSANLSEEMKNTFIVTGNEIPTNSLEITLPRMIMGVSRKWIMKEKFSLLAEAELDWTFDGKRNVLIKTSALSIDPHIGLEFGFKDIVFFRAGLGNIQQELAFNNTKTTTLQPNMGLGIRIKQFTIDYALTDIGDASVALYSNIFSVKFDLNKKTD